MGSVLAEQLGQLSSRIPNFVLLDPCPEGNEFKGFKAGNWAGWLGAEYSPVRVGGEFKIPDTDKLDSITDDDHEARAELQKFYSKKFENGFVLEPYAGVSYNNTLSNDVAIIADGENKEAGHVMNGVLAKHAGMSLTKHTDNISFSLNY